MGLSVRYGVLVGYVLCSLIVLLYFGYSLVPSTHFPLYVLSDREGQENKIRHLYGGDPLSHREELQKLGVIVQRRLHYLQNPVSCDAKRKLYCDVHATCGQGCRVNTITTCLMLAYALNRTMIINSRKPVALKPFSNTCNDIKKGSKMTDFDANHEKYEIIRFSTSNKYKPEFYPPAVPEDLFDQIHRYHEDPFVWWTGQMSSYVFRLSNSTYENFIRDEYMAEYQQPVVGIHVRRTDKIGWEAELHTLEEYMKHVESWFKHRPDAQPKLFLATDEPSLLSNVSQRYPHYKVISNSNYSTAAKKARESELGQIGITHDIYFLSKCNYVVCTFSSNICRLAYQLMTADRGNSSHNVVSLDDPWYFWGENADKDKKRPILKAKMPVYPDDV